MSAGHPSLAPAGPEPRGHGRPLPASARVAAGIAAALRSPFESTVVFAALFAVALTGFYDLQGLPEVVLALRLPDTDDAMRLVDVRALLAGQAWFDPVQHRLLPPLGVASHWSRLVDAPIAGLILALRPFLGERVAEGATAAAWPALTFAAYAALLFRAARAAFGPRAGWLALFAACQTVSLAGLFAFGRIDHHNVQVCAVFGLVACLAAPGAGWPRTLAAGALAAFSLAVGLETLPFIAAAGLVLAALWVRDGAPAARPLAGFGLGLATTAPLLFAAQTDPGRWGLAACDALSPPWLWLAGGAGLAALLTRAPLASSRARLLAAGGLGAALAAGFALLFPACLAGPFGPLPPLARTEWLEKVGEARSFWSHLRGDPALALSDVVPVLLATLVAGRLSWRRRDRPESRFLLLSAAMLATGSLIAQVQIRGVYVAGAFVPPLAGLALDRALASLRDPAAGASRRAATLLVAVALLGRVWIVATAAAGSLGIGPVVAAEPADPCTAPKDLAALDALAPGLVLAPIDLGPAILLHTRHAVVAAPYHRDVAGIVAGIEAFGGDAQAAHAAARASGATYFVACPSRAQGPGATTFSARLARGEVAVPWLAPAAVPGSALRAWRIAPNPPG